jgi:methionine biosynthesis protein MetW
MTAANPGGEERGRLSFPDRPDYRAIAGWVRPGASVLDLGCGDGTLLGYLEHTSQVRGYGVDMADASILACVRKGVNVLQSNLERGLAGFDEGSFDYVILSQTLQAVRHTEEILMEMLRVGREAIVTFPNFGYWPQRLQVLWQGRMPVSESLPYQWYDTPNVHLFTIDDFEMLCRDRSIRILERVVLHEGQPVRFAANLRGSLAVYRMERG